MMESGGRRLFQTSGIKRGDIWLIPQKLPCFFNVDNYIILSKHDDYANNLQKNSKAISVTGREGL
jgi:hypothetical protein